MNDKETMTREEAITMIKKTVEEEIQRQIEEFARKKLQDQIERFARTVGLPYDNPDLFEEFHPQEKDWNYSNGYTMARMSVLAYQNEEIVKYQLGNSGNFKWFENRVKDTQGFGYARSDSLVISFRGTESKRDAMLDLQRHRIDFMVNDVRRGKVHNGFSEALDSVWDQVEKFIKDHMFENEQGGEVSRRIWLTGHSLGGAIATLCAAKIAHIYGGKVIGGVYTFGQPRVGNRDFQTQAINAITRGKIFRIYRSADPIAMLPRIGYRHVSGKRCYISRSGELHFDAPWIRRAFERSITWGSIIPRLLTSGGRLGALKRLVSDHFSQGYLARLRDAKENHRPDPQS